MPKRSYLIAALVIAFASVSAQWIQRDAPVQPLLERVKHGGTLVVGYALEPPFALIDDAGRVSGEAPEVFRHVASQIGPATLEFVHADFGSLIHELEAGRVDVIAAGMFITPERAQRVLFSRPTVGVCPALLLAAANPHRLHSLSDFARQPSLRLGVISGAVEVELARAAGLPDAQVVSFPDAVSAHAAVNSNRVDAFVLSAVSLRHMLQKVPDGGAELAMLRSGDGGPLAAGQSAFVFRKQDRSLRDAVDTVLDRFIGSDAHLALIAPFGITAGELPLGGAAGQCTP